MSRAKLLMAGALAACTAALPARADPVLDYGITAYLSLDAGDAHWFTNFVEWGTVSASPQFDHAVADTVGGGAQAAQTTALARIGSLGGSVQASSSGYILSAGQGADDLLWATDMLVTGVPGTQVSFRFATRLDGFFASSGSHAGGTVGATTFVGGIPLADWHLDSLANPGAFNRYATTVQSFEVGTVVRLSSRLTVGARAEQDNAAMQSNALNSSVFYLDVLSPGGGYLTGGGVVFANVPAVPEPPSAVLLALGLAVGLAVGLALRGRRLAQACGNSSRTAGPCSSAMCTAS